MVLMTCVAIVACKLVNGLKNLDYLVQGQGPGALEFGTGWHALCPVAMTSLKSRTSKFLMSERGLQSEVYACT